MSKTLKLFKDLYVPFPDSVKKTKKQGGQTITFVEWTAYVVRAHNTFPQGYSKSVTGVTQINGRNKEGEPISTLVVTVRITDNETGAYQEALGSADAGKTSWGGAIAEAESQAFRRAMANWGLGLEMYLSDDEYASYDDLLEPEGPEPDPEPDPEPGDADPEPEPPTPRQVSVMRDLGAILKPLAEDDPEVEELLGSLRLKMQHPTKKVAGVVIRMMRAKLEDLGIADPTEA